MFSLDNRKLKAFQDAGVNIPFQKLDQILEKEMFKFRDYLNGLTDGSSITIRGN